MPPPARHATPLRGALLVLAVLLLAALVFLPANPGGDALSRVREKGVLAWGGDAEGGAPYVFPEPKAPGVLVGFEVDLADALARELGVRAVFVQNGWDSLVPALERGDFDVALNGLEVTPERAARVLFTRPYYAFTEQVVVRKGETAIGGYRDLPGKRVGTLSGAVSTAMLDALGGVDVRVYAGVVEPYEDLAHGRLDAVFLDTPIAAYYARPDARLRYAGPPVGEGVYGIAVRRGDEALRDALDAALDRLLRSGEIKRIYERWGLWDAAQERLFRGQATAPVPAAGGEKAPLSAFLPALLRGAGITVLVSAVAMAVAVVLGLALCLIRVHGAAPLRGAATAYVEVFRGTPLLIQLYILYYGLPNVGVTLSPLAAAFAGLGMNYAAYEAELYRAGIDAVPRGQVEAALSLGMDRGLAFRRIVLPQALRTALPGMTNDFIALFKDSSLVSIIAMVELTKTYNILAASTLRFLELGLVAALLYFAMSYPLSRLARRLEKRLAGGPR